MALGSPVGLRRGGNTLNRPAIPISAVGAAGARPHAAGEVQIL